MRRLCVMFLDCCWNILGPRWWKIVCVITCLCPYTVCGEEYKTMSLYSAVVNITYKDPASGHMRSEKEEIARYGTSSRLDSEWGWVVHVRTSDNQTHGCTPPVNVPASDKWVALIERGTCKFNDKIHSAAIDRNASAVVVYNDKEEADLLTMELDHKVDDVVSIFISKHDGDRIARLVDNGTRVLMHISVGRQHTSHYSNINKTSVLFVSISFIVLMIISLAWLVFYYIQRFRYAHAKERLSKRLMNAAKKAITKMPIRTVKSGDKETDSEFDQCAVCIECYKTSDVIRILPCKHVFHKSCVDPWLIEQRSCPMCKLDILKAYGLQIHGSGDSMVNIELEGPSTSMAHSEALHANSSVLEESSPHGGVEIIHYQPAQVEYHENSSGLAGVSTDSPNKVINSASMESVHSTESESSELQSLMPLFREGVVPKEPVST